MARPIQSKAGRGVSRTLSAPQPYWDAFDAKAAEKGWSRSAMFRYLLEKARVVPEALEFKAPDGTVVARSGYRQVRDLAPPRKDKQ